MNGITGTTAVEIAKSIKLGSGMEAGTQMGPLVSGHEVLEAYTEVKAVTTQL